MFLSCRELPTVDMKCQDGCWYCISACDYCLKPASLGFNIKGSQGTPSRFCSSTCQSVFHEQLTSPKLTIKPISSDVCDRSCKEDQDLLHLRFNCTNPAGINFEIKMNLCSGDKDTHPYLLYHLRTLRKQEFVEFFVNRDLSPSEPLPYLPKEYSATFSDLYTFLLKEALQTKECEHIHAFFKDSIQPRATAVQQVWSECHLHNFYIYNICNKSSLSEGAASYRSLSLFVWADQMHHSQCKHTTVWRENYVCISLLCLVHAQGPWHVYPFATG